MNSCRSIAAENRGAGLGRSPQKRKGSQMEPFQPTATAHPYFCPNCRSNRVKFSLISQIKQRIRKDAATGEIVEQFDAEFADMDEVMVQCEVCSFTGNELRFIKQAERDPLRATSAPVRYRQ